MKTASTNIFFVLEYVFIALFFLMNILHNSKFCVLRLNYNEYLTLICNICHNTICYLVKTQTLKRTFSLGTLYRYLDNC